MLIWSGLIIYVILINFIVSNIGIKNKKKVFLIIAGIGIIFVMGSRNHLTGIEDTNVYYNYYEYISKIPFKDIFQSNPYGFEFGYILLNKITSLFFPNPQTILYLEATICVTCTLYFIYKNSEKPLDSCIYFICFGCMMFALSGFRQAIAMGICLLSVESIKKRKVVQFIIYICIACSFHQTAIIFLISYFIINSNFEIKHNVLLIGLLITVLIFNNQIILIANQMFDRNYSGYKGSSFNGIMYVIIDVLIIAMALITKRENNDNNKIGINMTVLSLIFFLLGYFVEISQRISWYFLYGTIVAIPNLYSLTKNTKAQKSIQIIFLTFAIMIFIHRFSNNVYNNYVFFWEQV